MDRWISEWALYSCPKCGRRHLVPVETIEFVCGACFSNITLFDDNLDDGLDDDVDEPPLKPDSQGDE